MRKLPVKDARATFAKVLKGPDPTLITARSSPTALVVPIDPQTYWTRIPLLRALTKAQAAANKAFRELRRPLEAKFDENTE